MTLRSLIAAATVGAAGLVALLAPGAAAALVGVWLVWREMTGRRIT